MNISQVALNAIRESQLSGPNVAALFERMAENAATVASQGGLLILSYLPPEVLPSEGELVPTITLALKPFSMRRLEPIPKLPQYQPQHPLQHPPWLFDRKDDGLIPGPNHPGEQTP